ncbi:MAG: adenine deaminase [Chloroflexota bacterium]|jgi:adenine deaminase|nr:adenine deaminase [Chloroflexota bacterium]
MFPVDSYDTWARRIAIAQGREPADAVITGARVLNVFTQELIAGDLAIADGTIVGVGTWPDAQDRIDRSGCILAPSFIDAHIHIESSMLWVPEFARAVVPHGTGAVIADPHEVANVAGIDGIAAMRGAATGLPLSIHWAAPSCVPASDAESPGASLTVEEISEVLAWNETAGLGEMMDFPAVLRGNRGVYDKLRAARAMPRDGHAPGLRGLEVQAYAGAGIGSDHESTNIDEARDKLEVGMMLMLRQGSSEKNALDLLPLVTDATWHRCCFASDDRDAHDLLHNGHVDDILRTVIAAGLDPIRAITMATWNPASSWRLGNIGALAPGYQANFVVLDADLNDLRVMETWFAGQPVAEDGSCMANLPAQEIPSALTSSIHLAPVHLSDLQLAADDAALAVQVIPGQIVTRVLDVHPVASNGFAVADPGQDLLKLACVERHHATGRVGVGLVHGFRLWRGAIAGSIGHDAHNIMAVGADDIDLLAAIATVADMQGGLAVVADGQVLATMPLAVAGLMSESPLRVAAHEYESVELAAKALGSTLDSPFGILAFLGLSVIPEARVTDRGFLDLR